MSKPIPLTERLIHLRDATGDRGYRDTLAEAINTLVAYREALDRIWEDWPRTKPGLLARDALAPNPEQDDE